MTVRTALRRALAGAAAAAALAVVPAVSAPTASAAPTGADLCAQVGFTAGFRGEVLVTAVAIALAESGCNPLAANPSGALGLWQVHAPAHPAYSQDCLKDPQCNAGAAFAISSQGSNWRPWTVFVTGAYTSKLSAARAAVAKVAGQPGSVLVMDRWLRPNESIVSPNGQYEFFMQGDGNAVLYRYRSAVLFTTRTGVPGSSLILQSDGNLVVYSPSGAPLWASYIDIGPGAKIFLHDSGNLIEYAASGAIAWYRGSLSSASPPPPPAPGPDRMLPGTTLTSAAAPLTSTSGAFKLYMQGDGNLVLYSPYAALWAVRTEPGSGAFLALQPDGNLVLYDRTSARWTSHTGGNPGAWLIVQNDGNVVLYTADGKPIWYTNADTANLLR